MVIVTQADRDIAAYVEEGFFMSRRIRAGTADSHKVVQLIAAHRIAAIEECAKVARFALRNEGIVGSILALKGGNDD